MAHIATEPILHTVAATKERSEAAPCRLEPLLALINQALGHPSLGPSVPGFTTECVMTGLIVLRQHPVLAQVRFLAGKPGNAIYEEWYVEQCDKLKLGATLDIKQADAQTLASVGREAEPIVHRML